jgi:V-type H+-transporting ATPase subunit H
VRLPSLHVLAPSLRAQHISAFVDWLCAQLRRPSSPSGSVPLSVCCLSALLRERGTRALFLRAGGVQVLPPLLKTANTPANTQLVYELCLCVWQMTFAQAHASALAAAGGVKAIVGVAKAAQKEKVFRVALASLRNLLCHDELGLSAVAVTAGLPQLIAQRSQQHWGDADVPELLAFLDERLKADIAVLSSFDLYKKEVLGGALDWSSMHTSDAVSKSRKACILRPAPHAHTHTLTHTRTHTGQFWREHVDKLEAHDFQVLRLLLKLIESSRDARTVAVGCSDIGNFISAHPHGRFIVNDLHGKVGGCAAHA